MLRLTQRLLRAPSAQLVVLTGAQALLAAVFAVMSARWLGPSDRGVVVLVSTFGSLLMLVGSLGTATGGRMLLSRSDPRYDLAQGRRAALGFAAVHLCTVSVLGWPLLKLTGGWRGPGMAVAFAAYGSILVAIYVLREALHGTGRHLTAVGGDVLMAALLVIGAILFWFSGRFSLSTAVPLMAIAAAAELLLLLWVSRANTRELSHPRAPMKLGMLLHLSRPALVATFAQAFVIRGDRLLLGTMSDTTRVGLYGTAATFTEVTWLIALALSQVAFRAAGQGNHSRVKSLRRYCVVGTIVVAAATAALAKPAVAVLLGDAYTDAVPLIWLLLGAATLMATFLFESAVLTGTGQMGKPALSAVVGATLLVVGCFILIPHLGAQGAAIASIVAYAAMAGLVLCWSRNKRGAATR